VEAYRATEDAARDCGVSAATIYMWKALKQTRAFQRGA
jgi:hypothetical protein